jgi:hypothetical protein
VIDMLLADLTAAEQTELDQKVIVPTSLTSQKTAACIKPLPCTLSIYHVSYTYFAAHQLFQAAQQGHAGDLLALISDGASVDAESNVRVHIAMISYRLQIAIQ